MIIDILRFDLDLPPAVLRGERQLKTHLLQLDGIVVVLIQVQLYPNFDVIEHFFFFLFLYISEICSILEIFLLRGRSPTTHEPSLVPERKKETYFFCQMIELKLSKHLDYLAISYICFLLFFFVLHIVCVRVRVRAEK